MLRFFQKHRSVVTACLMLVLAQGIITGCSRIDFGADPLAFLTSGFDRKDKREPPTPDLFTGIQPFEPKPSGMLGSLSFNLDMYLTDDLHDSDKRMRRLEQAVIALHEDVKAMAPAIQKLVELQHDPSFEPNMIHNAPGRMNVTGAPQNLRKASILSPADQIEVKAGSRDMSPIPPGTTIISGLRIGEHADKIRLVFDATGITSYFADLDNSENILVVEFPDAVWKGPDHETFSGKTHILQSYKAGSSGKGNVVVVQLKKPSNIIYQGKFPALSGSGQRIVIDLKK